MTLAPPAAPTPATPSAVLPPADPPVAAEPRATAPGPGARAVSLVLVVVGALIAVGTISGAAFSTVASLAVRTSTLTAQAAGVTRLVLDVDATDLRIEFARVSAIELEVTGREGADRWTLDADGPQLTVSGGDEDGGLLDRGTDAVLRLPLGLSGIDADLTLDAGELSLDGEFGALAVTLGAADAELVGSADALRLSVEAGEVDLGLANVEDAVVTATASDVTGDLGGAQPDSIRIVAEASDVDLTVTDGAYRLTGDAADGDVVDTDIVSSPEATSVIDVRATVSDVTVSRSR